MRRGTCARASCRPATRRRSGRGALTASGARAQLVVLPGVEELQTGDDTRGAWIDYSALDARATLELHGVLSARLAAMECRFDKDVMAATGDGGDGYTMLDMYNDYWRPFGELLTDMEHEGMMVNRCAAIINDCFFH